MKTYLISLFLGLINIDSYAYENTKTYQYEDFLNASDRGVYLQEQIDSLNIFKENKCVKVLKFKQLGNDNLVLHLQAICEGFDKDLYLFLPKTVDKDLIINTCNEIENNPKIKVRCGESLK